MTTAPLTPPTPLALARLLPQALLSPVDATRQVGEKYGGIVPIRFGRRTSFHLISDPAWARHILRDNHANYTKSSLLHDYAFPRMLGRGLLVAEGEFWRKQRRTLQPAFRAERIAALAGAILSSVNAMLDGWEARLAGREFNLAAEMIDLARAINNRLLFSHDRLAARIIEMRRIFDRYGNLILASRGRWMRFGRTNFTSQIDALRDEVAALVAERYRSAEPAADLLDYLIHAPDHVSGNPMPPGQVLDELITLIFAGSETTEKALAWIFYLLASHPDIEAGLHETIRRIPGRIAFEHLPLLEPLRPVIEETLRLYPPAWILGRRARQDDPFMGYLIPAGERAVINVYAIHHNPRLWRDPETFDPARFADPLLEARNNGNYLAFGLGPRFCLGSHLSMVEMQLTVASILQRYKLRPARAKRVDASPQISLAPRNGIWMTLEKR